MFAARERKVAPPQPQAASTLPRQSIKQAGPSQGPAPAPPAWNIAEIAVSSPRHPDDPRRSLGFPAPVRRSNIAARLTIEPEGSPAEHQAEAFAASGSQSSLPVSTAGSPGRAAMARLGGHEASEPAPAVVRQALGSAGSPLDPASRAYFEPRFGQDLGGVRLHTGDTAARSAKAIGALAYAAGEHIVLGRDYSPSSGAARQLLAHELTHVVQQRHSGAEARTLARAPDKHQPGSSRSESLSDLHDILVKLLKSLDRKTQLSVMGFKTIALGLVEGTDEAGSAFQTLVYTASGNWASVDLEAKAAALGITRWNARARGEGRGDTGAPEDAEQLLIEGQDQSDMVLLGMAVSRKPCFDCAEALVDESVESVFVDPAKHLAKRQKIAKVKPSAAFGQAQAAIEMAFAQQLLPAGETAHDLDPKSDLWSALNGLDIKELYRVLEETSAERRAALAPKAVKAEGIGEQRILAVLDVLLLKRENFKEKPDALRQAIVSNLIQSRLALIPDDQADYLLKQLYPSLRLAPKPKAPAPKKTEPQKEAPTGEKKNEKTKEEPTNSYIGPIVKTLAALGVTAATIEAAGDFLAAIASDIFTNVVLRGIVDELKVPVEQAIKESVEETIKNAGPKARVFTEKVLKELPERIAHDLEDGVEKLTHGYMHVH